MITYKDILFSTTKILSDNFNCDVIVENQEGTFENECFYVTLVPVTVKEAFVVSFNIKATIPLCDLITADLANCLNDISIIGNPI